MPATSLAIPSFSTLYRVDAIEATIIEEIIAIPTCFSTLYRVDAIEAPLEFCSKRQPFTFQYPLSGRCY